MIGRSGFAVGLSAISFSASLQKDVASIPNAFAAANSMLHTIPKNPNPKIEETCQCVFIFNETLTRLYNNSKLQTNKALPYPIFVSPFQGSYNNK